MAKKKDSLSAAMEAGDLLAEAERRYRIIAELLDPARPLGEGERGLTGTEVKALSIEADRLMHKIVALRAEKAVDAAKADAGHEGVQSQQYGKVVALDADRFRRSS